MTMAPQGHEDRNDTHHALTQPGNYSRSEGRRRGAKRKNTAHRTPHTRTQIDKLPGLATQSEKKQERNPPHNPDSMGMSPPAHLGHMGGREGRVTNRRDDGGRTHGRIAPSPNLLAKR